MTQRIKAISLAIQKQTTVCELVKADTRYAPSVCESSNQSGISSPRPSNEERRTGVAVSRGTRIYYETLGRGSDLLLINGCGASGLGWEPSFLIGLARAHRVIAMDNRGTGRSDKPDAEYTVPLMASDCLAVLDAAGAEKSHVLGVSMGGLIAQELVLSFPDRVSSLTLCCTSCGQGGRSTRPGKVFARLFLRPEERLRLRMELLYSKNFITKEWPRLREQWKEALKYPTPLHSYRRQWTAMMNYCCCDKLQKIEAPALIMGGDEDRLNPVECLRELADGIAHSELQVYSRMGHGFIMEARDRVLERILQFVERVDGTD